MKKLIAALLCLCMVLTSVCAVAEEVAQAVLAQTFQSKIMEFMGRMAPGKALTYTGSTPEGKIFDEKITLLPTADGDLLEDLTIAMPGLDQPLTVQLSTNKETIWVSYQGTVMELRIADLPQILQTAASAFSAPQMDSQVAQELAQLLLQDVILPGIAVENGENSTTIRLALTAKDVLTGLAAFGDQVLANEKYWNELKPLLQYYARQQQYQGDIAAEFEQGWPQIKEQLLATESDAKLNATVMIATQPEDGATMVVGKIIFSSQGQAFTLALSAANDAKKFELSLSVSMGAGFMEATLGTLDVSCDKEAGNLTASLNVPVSQLAVNLTGSLTQKYGTASLQAHLDVLQRRALVFALDLESISAGGVTTANAALTAGQETVTSNVYWSNYVKTLKVSTGGQCLTLDVRNDDIGNFTAKLSLPNLQGDFNLEGNVTSNSLRAALTYSNPRLALSASRAMAGAFSADLTAAWGYSATVSVNVNVGRATYAGQIYWSSTSKVFSFQSDEKTIVLNVQQDASGAITLARLIQGSGSSYQGGFELLYTPDGIEYHDNTQDVKATWAYESETEFVVDIAVSAVGSSAEAQHAYLRVSLIDAGEDWRIEGTVVGPDGSTLATVTMACEAAGEIELLSEKNPMRITPEMVLMLLQQMTQPQQNIVAPAYHY